MDSTSAPSMSGKPRSSNTTSGFCSTAADRAGIPEPTAVTTCPCSRSARVRALRIAASSSTSSS
jgi:hypothetical protein